MFAGSPYGPSGPTGGPPDIKVAGPAYPDPSATAMHGAPEGPAAGTALLDPVGPPDQIADGDRQVGMPPPGAPRQRRSQGRSTAFKFAIVGVAAVAVVGVGGGAAFALSGGSDDDKATVSPKPAADAAKPTVDVQALEKQRREQSMNRAGRAARSDAGKAPPLYSKGSPPPTKKPKSKGGGSGGGSSVPPTGPVDPGSARDIARTMMGSWGWRPSSEFGCLDQLWKKESGWRYNAANPSSGAYGIPQALPGSKMASAGSDWRTSARTQIKWGFGYIKDRYGTPCDAWGHSQSAGWY